MIEKELNKAPNRFDEGGIKIEDGKVVEREGNHKYYIKDVPSTTVNEDQVFEMSIDDLISLLKAADTSIEHLEKELNETNYQADRLINSISAELKERNVGCTVDKEAVNHDRLVVKTRITLLQELIGSISIAINNSNTYLVNPVVKYIGRLGKLSDTITKFTALAGDDQ